ncbi:putative disease resistance protein RGA1 [Salvia divinorum]|uniref:Disease resistance protein RGA1 n=1 Tax=Salvia divinorum TaxID=28513 RepID=A0ABD1FU89_SALDI
MNKRATDLGIQSMAVNAPAVAPVSFETDSLSLDPIFIGRDDDVPKLVDILTQNHPEEEEPIFSILALVGMGGMGKTMLTRKVCNHERVKARFGSPIWVHVSQTFDPISLFKKILSTLTSHIGKGVQSREVILKKLQEALNAKTYLLVLDDVWNANVPKWENFINSYSEVTSTKGNGIIITTSSNLHADTNASLQSLPQKCASLGAVENRGAAAIEVLVQNLIKVLKEEYSLLRGLDEDAQQLQTTLGMIQAYLNDAEKKSITEDAVKFWLRELEAVAFDADNALDKLSHHLLHKKVKKMKTPKAKDKVLSCFSSFNHISHRRNMAHTIKKINADFESMNKRATDLGLQSMIVNAPVAANTSSETDSFSLDRIFIGRDDDLPQLVQMLTRPSPVEHIFSIVSLVGMGGLGKTTLTRKVFNDERVKARFKSLIWVHVSQTFDSIIIFKKIFSALTREIIDEVHSREVILKKLEEALKSKTYLLVLDDVWNEDVSKWEDFINSMSGVTSTKENGIVITTRNKKVASIVNPLEIHLLSGLSDDACWSIIKTKAFDGNGEVPSGFETIGRKIAKRCKGLPLAANVVGGVLRFKSEEEWHFISENWLSDNEGGENISKILKLSFDHLSSPSHKKCFAYCSIFPKDRWIMKRELIELWMAEGFLQPSQRDDMESVGNMLFNVLLQNSLLQVAERSDYVNGECYLMHDLVHDLASSVLSNNADVSTPVRYMFLEEESNPIPKKVAKHLRTLFLEGGITSTMLVFSNFQCLHNLTLTGSNYSELPNSIRKLIHLRNLNISNTRIRNLPEWIDELHHLQTLELPTEIGRLTNLQTLRYFSVGKEKGYRIEELGNLKNLKGTLEIQHLERVCDKEEAMKANMFQKPNLYDLQFQWNSDREDERNDESVLEGLHPHANLKKLWIDGFQGKRFPTWTKKMAVQGGLHGYWVPLDNLIEITPCKCWECEEIPTLEHLPHLKSLTLRGLKKGGYSMTIRIFQSYGLLSAPVLRELPDGVNALNSLDELIIRDCPKLKSIGNPSGEARESQGILRSLWITECGELMELSRQMLDSWTPTIEDLQLKGLRSLKNLPVLIDCLAKSSHLRRLTILDVPNFMATGRVESWDLGSLEKLKIDVSVEWSMENSGVIRDTVDGILQGCCNSLSELHLGGAANWDWLPQSIQCLTTLSQLTLSNFGMEELPQWFKNLSSLWELRLFGCNKLRCLPSAVALKHLARLKSLQIKDCQELSIDSKWHSHCRLKTESGATISAVSQPCSQSWLMATTFKSCSNLHTGGHKCGPSVITAKVCKLGSCQKLRFSLFISHL